MLDEETTFIYGDADMVWLLRKCEKCRKYTLNLEKCPYCGGSVRVPHPAKFSPHDKYVKYRQAMKRFE